MIDFQTILLFLSVHDQVNESVEQKVRELKLRLQRAIEGNEGSWFTV